MWLDTVMCGSEDNSKPVCTSSTSGAGDVDAMSTTSECAWLNTVCSTAMGSGEVEAFGMGEEVGTEGPGEEKHIVLAEVSVLPHVARVVNGFS